MKYRGSIITEGSGSVSGLTFSHNRGGQYIRRRGNPVNPNTARQSQVRSIMAELTTNWGDGLTSSQRDAWDLYALNTLLPDSLGEPRNIGGIGHYVRSNVPRGQAGMDIVINAPTTFGLASLTPPTVTADISSQNFSVTFDAFNAWANATGGALLVRMGRPVSRAVNGFKGPFRFVGAILGDDSLPPEPPVLLTPLPFPFASGQGVWFAARATLVDGRLSSEVIGRCTLVA